MGGDIDMAYIPVMTHVSDLANWQERRRATSDGHHKKATFERLLLSIRLLLASF